jgi:hypothetical protein
MLENIPGIRMPYEVVKTIGFDWETTDETGQAHVFTLRIDAVRFLGTNDYAPVVWQVADTIGDVLMMHTSAGKTTIRGAGPDEVIQAFVDSLHRPDAGQV